MPDILVAADGDRRDQNRQRGRSGTWNNSAIVDPAASARFLRIGALVFPSRAEPWT